jgi:outer membrane protein assembly factor BamB
MRDPAPFAVLLLIAGCDRTLEGRWALGGYAGLSSPTIGAVRGAVMFATEDDVVCLASADGGFGWSVELEDGSAAAVPVLDEEGTTWVLDGDQLRSIDPDGVPLRSFAVPGVVHGPALDADGLLVLAGIADGTGFVRAVTPSGARRWQLDLPEPPVARPLLHRDGGGVVETEAGAVGFDGNGHRTWSSALDPSDGVAGVLDRDRRSYLVRGGSLVALGPTGQVRWRLDGVVGSPAAAHDAVIVPTDDGLVAVDLEDGGARWRVRRPCGPAAVGSDGHAYAACSEGDRVGIVEVDPGGDVVYSDAVMPGAPSVFPPLLAFGDAVITSGDVVQGWDGAAPLAGRDGPRAGADGANSSRTR